MLHVTFQLNIAAHKTTTLMSDGTKIISEMISQWLKKQNKFPTRTKFLLKCLSDPLHTDVVNIVIVFNQV